MEIEEARRIVSDLMENRDKEDAELISQILVQSEEAKQILRSKGHGVTGTGVVRTSKEVPDLEGLWLL